MRKICFVTGTRAEYGLLCRLMRLVADDPDLQLQIVATNMHLLPEYGMTYREIEKMVFNRLQGADEQAFGRRTWCVCVDG